MAPAHAPDDNGFARCYGPFALVAGASEGIGRSFALALAARGVGLLLTARRPEPLAALAAELAALHPGVPVRTLALDLGRPDLGEALAAGAADLELGLLVYNAAHSVIGPFLARDLAEHERTLAVNCRGPLVLCHQLGRPMAARGRGGIVLLSSMSGLQGTAVITSYAASKAYDLVLAEGLWEELRASGVDVLACVAGATRTPAYERSAPRDGGRFARPMDPDAVAREALDALGRVPSLIPGRQNRLAAAVMRLLPRARAIRIISDATRRMYAGRGEA